MSDSKLKVEQTRLIAMIIILYCFLLTSDNDFSVSDSKLKVEQTRQQLLRQQELQRQQEMQIKQVSPLVLIFIQP